MVDILSVLSMDINTLYATLLFLLVDAEIMTKEILHKSVGKTITTTVHETHNITTILQIKTIFTNKVNNIYCMLLVMVNDFRCIIKLVERVMYLRKTKDASKNERTLVAIECNKIYVPLINHLGIWQLKWELEDYCFRYLYPTEYKYIAKLLQERRIDREYYIKNFVKKLQEFMKEKGVKVKIYGRPKHIYSIWLKMKKKNLAFDRLFDIQAVRVVAEKLQYCYLALDIVHMHFCHLPNEFDDYITHPKPNGYQSIHTVVLGPGGKKIEIQFRTKKMHEDAEVGIAAHWKYKEAVSAITYITEIRPYYLIT